MGILNGSQVAVKFTSGIVGINPTGPLADYLDGNTPTAMRIYPDYPNGIPHIIQVSINGYTGKVCQTTWKQDQNENVVNIVRGIAFSSIGEMPSCWNLP